MGEEYTNKGQRFQAIVDNTNKEYVLTYLEEKLSELS